MRRIRRLFGLSTSKAQNVSLLEPTSLAAFGQSLGALFASGARFPLAIDLGLSRRCQFRRGSDRYRTAR